MYTGCMHSEETPATYSRLHLTSLFDASFVQTQMSLMGSFWKKNLRNFDDEGDALKRQAATPRTRKPVVINRLSMLSLQ